MEDYELAVQGKKSQKIKSIVIYSAITILTIVINIPVLIVTIEFVGNITAYLDNIFRIYPRYPAIFPHLWKLYSMLLMVNIFLLLMIEFVIVCLFRRRLNKFFKIDNLFTIKKILIFAITVVVVQFFFSLWLWLL